MTKSGYRKPIIGPQGRPFRDGLKEPILWDGPLTREWTATLVGQPYSAEKKQQNAKAFDEESRRVFNQLVEKLPPLAEHFGISSKNEPEWAMLLLIQLAIEFVPGFSVVPKLPKATKWDLKAKLELIATVKRIQNEEGKRNIGDLEACRRLVRRERSKYLTDARLEKEARSKASRLAEARTDPFIKPILKALEEAQPRAKRK